MSGTLVVTAQWDEDAKVWVATSDDIPGLVTESVTLDSLVQRVLAVAPELMEDNSDLCRIAQLPVAGTDRRF
jgi:hypothetical protein